MQVLRDVEPCRRGLEADGIDDQGVPLPAADRVPHPLAQRLWPVLGVEADDARVVDLLGEDHHVVIGLDDPLEVVVEGG